MFEPLGDKLIVQPVEAEEMSAGGILIPDLENARTVKAKVLAKGPGAYQFGHLIPTSTEIGDNVLYQHFSAFKFEYEGTEYHIIKESEIICKVKENEK